MKKIIRIIFIAIIYSVAILSCSPSIEKKQFDSNDELISAFKNVSYDDVVKKLGEPYFKLVSSDFTTVQYRWHGVGVKGRPDAVIWYTVYSSLSGQYEGNKFTAMSETENGY